MRRIIFLMFVVFLAASFFISCDDPDNPVPSLTQISPSEADAGSAAFTMTLEGSNFVSDSKVIFNGTAKATTYVSATELKAQIEATDIAEALAIHESRSIAEDYSVKVFVYNPPPGGGDSNRLDFIIKEITWQKTFGGSGTEVANSVQQTSDGGYIVAGSTGSYGAGDWDMFLVKIDSYGSKTWQKTFGSAGEESAYSVQQTSDGGYIVAGHTWGASGSDMFLVKTDSSGNVTWQKTFGGSKHESTSSVQQTSDGGYILAGTTYSYGAGNHDIFLVRTDSSGNVTWQKTFGGSERESASSVQQTSDGGYIVAGYTRSYGVGEEDMFLVKIDSSGSKTWQKTFGGSGDDGAYSVQQTSDMGYIVAGYIQESDAYDLFLVKINSLGNVTWKRTFGGRGSATSVQQTSDMGYIVAGSTGSYPDMILWKINSNGGDTWMNTFGGYDYDRANSVQQTTDGGYIVAGITDSYGAGDSDMFVVKTDKNGDVHE